MNKSDLSQSEPLFERALKVAPGGVHSPVRSFKGLERAPIFFKSAKGAYLTSVDGVKYIDFCQSFGPLILGHLDEDVKVKVHEMIDTAWSFGACEPYSLELAEFITAQIPFVEKVRFVSSGTEAVMSSLRLARAYTGKTKVIKFDGCYHGHVDSLLVKAGSGLAGLSAASSAGVSQAVAEETLIAQLDDEAGLERIFQEWGHDIAAVIIEPLPANYGLLIQRKDFLKKIKSLCAKHKSLFISDEVISGFRVSLTGMSGDWLLEPDLVCYGKILGGGFPVGCYGGRKEIMDFVAPLGPVYQAGTLSANPIGMRAGLETLKKMVALNGWQTLNERTSYFVKQLKPFLLAKNLDISHFASLFWIHERVSDSKPIREITSIPQGQGEKFKTLFLKLLDEGVYLAPNAYEVGFLSLAHTDEVLDLAIQKITKVLSEMK
ncbi:MAG: glutamate-1-semialdehyde 2,1-aminomutase [Bdellovibrionaceae bacterium]|nr:glutamate-1-semialdehyde 2,1-aminomutase [Pseudobdellovibrionaceae bacterium]NUM58742.1 glutamate-1-semialdehyde 2,1-aminomutase [Pseudobdellovibrionaceae bacterium]